MQITKPERKCHFRGYEKSRPLFIPLLCMFVHFSSKQNFLSSKCVLTKFNLFIDLCLDPVYADLEKKSIASLFVVVSLCIFF